MRPGRRVPPIGGAVTLAACGTHKALPFEPTGGPPDPSATFGAVQMRVLNANRAFAGCHAGAAPQAAMNLSPGVAHSNIAGVRST